MAKTRVVIHADDVGMCHGTNTSFAELSHMGTITAGSVMVPCPWFSEIAEIAASDPFLDVGVHLTLNAEKDHYRWGPVSRSTPSSGLLDDDGFMWRRVHDVRINAHPDAVEVEWRAQIDRALAAGIDLTHLDAHMGSSLAPEWCDRYIDLGIEYQVPILITSRLAGYGPNKHLAGVAEETFGEFVTQARAAGLPVFDLVLETDFTRARNNPPDYRGMLGGPLPDLTFCAFHPCAPGPGEIEVIEADTAHVRTDEHHLFGRAEWKHWLGEQGFELLSMRALRDDFRSVTESETPEVGS